MNKNLSNYTCVKMIDYMDPAALEIEYYVDDKIYLLSHCLKKDCHILIENIDSDWKNNYILIFSDPKSQIIIYDGYYDIINGCNDIQNKKFFEWIEECSSGYLFIDINEAICYLETIKNYRYRTFSKEAISVLKSLID